MKKERCCVMCTHTHEHRSFASLATCSIPAQQHCRHQGSLTPNDQGDPVLVLGAAIGNASHAAHLLLLLRCSG
jgi:hypothetical protein